VKVVKTLHASGEKSRKSIKTLEAQMRGLQHRVESHTFKAKGLISFA
jgi:hypothetical protein